jgi:hypothetical protein
MFDLIIWITGLLAFILLFAGLGLLIVYGAYALLHQNDHGHLQHLDNWDETQSQPLLGVVAPKKQEDSYGPILTPTKRK